jgi:hypothetical protein
MNGPAFDVNAESTIHRSTSNGRRAQVLGDDKYTSPFAFQVT